eukprot:2374971-Pyramimonas_sp.AAC.1
MAGAFFERYSDSSFQRFGRAGGSTTSGRADERRRARVSANLSLDPRTARFVGGNGVLICSGALCRAPDGQ